MSCGLRPAEEVSAARHTGVVNSTALRDVEKGFNDVAAQRTAKESWGQVYVSASGRYCSELREVRDNCSLEVVECERGLAGRSDRCRIAMEGRIDLADRPKCFQIMRTLLARRLRLVKSLLELRFALAF